MGHVTTVVVGAGQCGIAMSRALARRSVEHVVLERGRIAGSWRSERWESLRLLAQTWISAPSGHPYRGPDPDAFMSCAASAAILERSALLDGAPTLAVSPSRTSTLYTYVPGIQNKGYRWYFGNRVTAGAIPTNDGLHCVFAACRAADHGAHFADPRNDVATVLAGFDAALAARLSGGAAERIRGFPGAPGHMRARAGDGWAPAGGAAFFKDAAIAHGITDALLDAHALAAFLSQDEGLTAYHRERDAKSRRIFDTTQRIASVDWSLYELRMLHERLNASIRDQHAATMPRLVPTG
jgi:flavin-dependent dehydrogenase